MTHADAFRQSDAGSIRSRKETAQQEGNKLDGPTPPGRPRSVDTTGGLRSVYAALSYDFLWLAFSGSVQSAFHAKTTRRLVTMMSASSGILALRRTSLIKPRGPGEERLPLLCPEFQPVSHDNPRLPSLLLVEQDSEHSRDDLAILHSLYLTAPGITSSRAFLF